MRFRLGDHYCFLQLFFLVDNKMLEHNVHVHHKLLEVEEKEGDLLRCFMLLLCSIEYRSNVTIH